MSTERREGGRASALALVLIGVVLAACGAPPSGAQASAAPTQSAARPATAAATAAATVAPTPVKKYEVNFGVIGSASSAYLHFVGKTKVWNQFVPEVNVTIVAAGSPTQNVAQLVTGEFNVVNFEPVSGYEMYNGLGLWKGKPIQDLRILFVDLDSSFVTLVREDSGVTSFRDLNGKPFNPGAPGSSAINAMKPALEVLGIKPNYVEGSFDAAVTAVQNKRVVGYTKGTGAGFEPDATMLQLSTQVKMRTITFTQAEADQIRAKFAADGKQYRPVTIPKGVHGGYYGSFDIFTFGSGLGQSLLKSFPTDLAYKMVKAAFEHKDVIGQSYPGYAKFDLAQQTLKYSTIPLHAGTVKYLKELGLNVPANLIPPEAK